MTLAWAVRTDQIQVQIQNNMLDVLHFSGHSGHESLLFENKHGKSVPVFAAEIKDLIKLSKSIDCLIMNACYSESIAKDVSTYEKITVISCTEAITEKPR